MNSPKPIVERLREFEVSDALGNGDFTICIEAINLIESLEADNVRMREALDYVRKNLGDPVPIGRRHVARVVDAALSPRGES